MVKKTIQVKDFNGNDAKFVAYFNLSEVEIMRLDAEYDGNLKGYIEESLATEEPRTILAFFERILLDSYGVKSEDGMYFLKNDEIRERFKQSAAYNTLFVELASDENVAAEFIVQVLNLDTIKARQ